MYSVHLSADDEEPDCGRCEYVCSGQDICDRCGPEYGWANYRHDVSIDEIPLNNKELLDRLHKIMGNHNCYDKLMGEQGYYDS